MARFWRALLVLIDGLEGPTGRALGAAFLVMSSLCCAGRRAPSWNRLRHQLGKERKWPRTIVIGAPALELRIAPPPREL